MVIDIEFVVDAVSIDPCAATAGKHRYGPGKRRLYHRIDDDVVRADLCDDLRSPLAIDKEGIVIDPQELDAVPLSERVLDTVRRDLAENGIRTQFRKSDGAVLRVCRIHTFDFAGRSVVNQFVREHADVCSHANYLLLSCRHCHATDGVSVVVALSAGYPEEAVLVV